MSIALSIVGATGRMGRSLLSVALKDPAFKVVSGIASARSPHVGKDLAALLDETPIGALLESTIDPVFEKAHVVIDVSTSLATMDHLQKAIKYRKPFIVGSTGHKSEARLAIEAAGKEIPILYAPNFTLGISLCKQAIALFGKHLKGSSYVDIIETHHVNKKDAPSGTALSFAKALNYGNICPGTALEQPRSKETVAIHSIRSGDVVGEHRIIFECAGERIEIKHEALTREAFAKGALKAAKFLSQQPAGFYTMDDILKYE